MTSYWEPLCIYQSIVRSIWTPNNYQCQTLASSEVKLTKRNYLSNCYSSRINMQWYSRKIVIWALEIQHVVFLRSVAPSMQSKSIFYFYCIVRKTESDDQSKHWNTEETIGPQANKHKNKIIQRLQNILNYYE